MEGFGFGSYSKTWIPTLGDFHLYNEEEREGGSHSWPHHLGLPMAGALATPSPQTLASPPPPLLPHTLRRSPAGVLHRHRHHAVVLSGFRGGSTTSAARWNGEKDVVFINTERVIEYGGAADCGIVKIFYALLKAGSDRLPQQREPPLVGFGNLQGLVSFIPSLLPSVRLHLGLDCVLAVGIFLFSMLRIPTICNVRKVV